MPSCLPRPPATPRRAPARRRWPLALAGGLVLAMVVVERAIDVGRYLEEARRWIGALGVLAPVAYILVYVAATLIGVPGTPFTLVAPVLFGAWPAVGVMIVASGLSAVTAFLIARYLARDAFVEWLARTDGFARLSGLLERHDWMVIPLLRIVPIAPFAVVNYGFGLTGVSLGRYTAWSLLAMIPMNLLLVLGADLLYTAATRGTASRPLIAAAIAAVLLLAGLAAAGRKAFVRS